MSYTDFTKPQRVVIDMSDENRGVFVFEPLEKGYGTTIGNALRRVILSSLRGIAITSIKIPNVFHEYSSIDGVMEDMVEIILNLKKIRFKKISQDTIKHFSFKIDNKERVLAEDIIQNNTTLQVLNPDLVICNLSKDTTFEMEIFVDEGRGYIPSEEQIKNLDDLNQIPIDSIFTPIKNVKYNIENTRVEQSIEFEKLTIEVETDGSIDPDTAMRDATDILIDHFSLFSNKGESFEPLSTKQEEDIMDDETLRIRKLLQTPISRLNLSVRAANCLKFAEISTLGELARLKMPDLLKIRNLGQKSLKELQKLMEKDDDLKFGMDLTQYKLEKSV